MKPIPYYVIIYFNRVELIRLDNKKSIVKTADKAFSNHRIIIAEFENFEYFLRSLVEELEPNSFIKLTNEFLMHVLEDLEGGLSSVEKRALVDSGVHSGGRKVKVYIGKEKLSIREALRELDRF